MCRDRTLSYSIKACTSEKSRCTPSEHSAVMDKVPTSFSRMAHNFLRTSALTTNASFSETEVEAKLPHRKRQLMTLKRYLLETLPVSIPCLLSVSSPR